MHIGSLSHDDVIRAFQNNVPGCYVRDYRDRGGFITICKNYRDIKWKDQLSGGNVYRQVPATTLVNLPKGTFTSATHYRGLSLERVGWRIEFRKAMRHLTQDQMLGITEDLNVQEVFPGVMSRGG